MLTSMFITMGVDGSGDEDNWFYPDEDEEIMERLAAAG